MSIPLTEHEAAVAADVIATLAKAGIDLRGYEHILVPLPTSAPVEIGRAEPGEFWMKIKGQWVNLGLMMSWSVTHEHDNDDFTSMMSVSGHLAIPALRQQRTIIEAELAPTDHVLQILHGAFFDGKIADFEMMIDRFHYSGQMFVISMDMNVHRAQTVLEMRCEVVEQIKFKAFP